METTTATTQDPDDCFHMISQLPWEEEVIWDGQEETPRIMTKIGKKCHAAGWIPSAMHRRASDFNHQVRDTATPTRTQQQNQSTNQVNSAGHNHHHHHGGGGGGGRSKQDKNNKQVVDDVDNTWHSIFPVENEDLVYGAWERDIIWDNDKVPMQFHRPRILTLDPNDENIIFHIPDDSSANGPDQSGQTAAANTTSTTTSSRKALMQQGLKDKKDSVRKSKIIINKSGVIVEPEVVSPPPEDLSKEKQPWNISNDEYYTFKATPDVALKQNVGSLIQHSTPAVELRQPFFPTFMNRDRLREFHRPPLFPSGKRARAIALAENRTHPVESLTKHIAQQAQSREKQRIESGGGEMFFWHSPEDLSGKDAELIFAEYSEEYPPLLSQVGMATKIKNYARRRPGMHISDLENELTSKYEYGEPAILTTNLFLGTLPPGQSLQTIENNMYRAPIYKHKFPHSDFLVIRSHDNQYWIREIDTIFTIGQELPIIEVPGPNSKKANNFIRDFLQVYIYRMFWKSPLEPKRIKMDDIKRAFPSHSESSIRKRLKQCADFNRTGDNPNMWYLKKPSEFRLPQEAEIRTIVTPEQCCAYYSMLAAERRLQDAGYGEKSLCTLEDDDDEDKQREMDDEVKAAPWNTTRAFIAAARQKCLLQLTGVADPTGCNEGFSYVRVPNKPSLPKEEAVKEPQPKRTVTGTDADLRRLKLSTAKAMLEESGVPKAHIQTLQRWEVIHLVRELSNKQVRAGEESMSKFARGNRFSIAEHQERYKEECQRIFDLQNKVLASDEVLSTDDEESNDEEDPDIEQGTKTLEFAIENKKSSQALFHEQEEAERRELCKMLEDSNSNDFSKMQGKIKNENNKLQSSSQGSNQGNSRSMDIENMDESSQMGPPAGVDRILKIYRTFRDNNGREYVRVETVRKPAVIDSYVKVRKTKDADAIREFASSSDYPQKDGKRKEGRKVGRKRINHEPKQSRGSGGAFGDISSTSRRGSPLETPRTTAPNSPSAFGEFLSNRSPQQSISPDNSTLDSGTQVVVKKRKEKDGSKLRCSACGGLGHMKNNRSCPAHPQSIQVAMTREEFEEEEATLGAMDIIKTEDTKITINKKFFDKFEEARRRSLKIKIPIEAIKRRRNTNQQEQLDYLRKPVYKSYRNRNKVTEEESNQ